MVKFTTAIVCLLSLRSSVTAVSLRDYIPSTIQEAVVGEAIIGPDGARQLDVQQTCFGGSDFSVYFEGECNYHEIVERMQQKIDDHDYCVNSGATEIQLLMGK
jgi:hypothetical protein